MNVRSKPVDPKLEKQLAELDDASAIEAIVTLRSPEGREYLTAAETEATIAKILSRLKPVDRSRCTVHTVFPNLQSLVLSGPPSVVQAVVDDRDVASATANQQSEDLLIRPVKTSARSSARKHGKAARGKPK